MHTTPPAPKVDVEQAPQHQPLPYVSLEDRSLWDGSWAAAPPASAEPGSRCVGRMATCGAAGA